MTSTADYPRSQWFDAPPPCRVCGAPAGKVMDTSNSVIAFMCRKHADAAIKAAHRLGHWSPDIELAPGTKKKPK